MLDRGSSIVPDFTKVVVDDSRYVPYIGYRVLRIIILNLFPVPVRLRCGSDKLIFVIIPSCFAIFNNVVQSLEPGETPSYLASLQAPNYVQRF